MTAIEPNDRPTATALREEILITASEGEIYCGICCGEDVVVSDDVSWAASGSEDEDGNDKEAITSSYTHTTSISSSLSPQSHLAAHGEKDLDTAHAKSKSLLSPPPVRSKAPGLELETQTTAFVTAAYSHANQDVSAANAQTLDDRASPNADDEPGPVDLQGSPVRPPGIQSVIDQVISRRGISSRRAIARQVSFESAAAHRVDERGFQGLPSLGPPFVPEEVPIPIRTWSRPTNRDVTSDPRTLVADETASYARRTDSVLSPVTGNGVESRTKALFWADASEFENALVDLREKTTDFKTALLEMIKPSATSKTFRSMLHTVACFERPELAKEIIPAYVGAGANVNALNFVSNIPLQYAAARDRMELVEYLLQSGADAAHTNIRKQTALHIAAREKSDGVVSILVKHMSADAINSKDDRGRTALHLACNSGDLLNAKILVGAGADVTITDNSGKSPLNICSPDKSSDFFHYFREQRVTARSAQGLAATEFNSLADILHTGLDMPVPKQEVGMILGPFGDGGPWGGSFTCPCETCKIVLAVAPLLDAHQQRVLTCTCSVHVGAMASQLLSSIEELFTGLLECPCRQCALSRRKCGDVSQLKDPIRLCPCNDCAEKENRYIPDLFSIDTYRGNTYYDRKIEAATPRPCACSDCKSFRGAAAVRLLTEAGFTGRKSYRLDTKRPWLLLIDLFAKSAMEDSGTIMPDLMRDVAMLLINAGANINTADGGGNTLLHVVAASGFISMARLLILAKAHLNIEDNQGDTPLANAILFHHPEMARLLLNAGAQIDKPQGLNKTGRGTLVHTLVLKYGSLGYMLPLILAHKPNLNAEDSNGIIPIQWAIMHEHEVAVRILIEAGANIELATRAAPKPLFSAIAIGSPELVKLLVTYGADVSGKRGQPSALHVAANRGAGDSIVVLLKFPETRKDVNGYDADKHTPLHLIADCIPREDCLKGAEAMIAAGASLTIEDNLGSTPLHIAAKVGSLPMTRLFVRAGAVPAAQNHAGKTACDLAVARRHRDVVDFLGGTMKKKRWYHRS